MKKKHIIKGEAHRQEGIKQSNGLITFGFFVIVLTWFASYVLNQANIDFTTVFIVGTLLGIVSMWSGNRIKVNANNRVERYYERKRSDRE